ncbi:hypothetical protein PoB_006288800 [Plakobranchus ocellatus]|uniref:Uncharacterized protein n=1 Tax=Plakobranchus ocellatus TaxID=259542 RepID=A0AAV4CWZ2_9GAST|nr:hypothetical protein PoB_006288800 [Plakobranchus ocellatus]
MHTTLSLGRLYVVVKVAPSTAPAIGAIYLRAWRQLSRFCRIYCAQYCPCCWPEDQGVNITPLWTCRGLQVPKCCFSDLLPVWGEMETRVISRVSTESPPQRAKGR